MIRTYMLEDLDCANCAQKIQDAVAKLDGVNSCNVTFITQKMVLDVNDDAVEDVEKRMKKLVGQLESEVTVKFIK